MTDPRDVIADNMILEVSQGRPNKGGWSCKSMQMTNEVILLMANLFQPAYGDKSGQDEVTNARTENQNITMLQIRDEDSYKSEIPKTTIKKNNSPKDRITTTENKCLKDDACDNLEISMRKHTVEKIFKCGFCDYASNCKGNLKKHMRIHTGEKSFKCGFCDYASNCKGNLKKHMRIHTGEKCLKCDVCDFACNHKGSLKEHMRIHTEEMRYKRSY
ncbi:zinc finger protein 64-like [Mercenaria mercenaria]|uniref:zinc finger protein 64-like n=1 Tax=Mercenaria mercenaria TaxID=6596 RepID=UPI00234E4B0E|nr:zinc finger protein 64-like [Mercenaria mercenaria]